MASGGSRPGAGRKPKLLTALLLAHPDAENDIRFAYDLFRNAMRDESHPIDLRLDCADKVLNRLCGKPAQSVIMDLGPDDEQPKRISVPRRKRKRPGSDDPGGHAADGGDRG